MRAQELFIRFSDDRRFFVPVLVLFVFFVLVIIIVGVSGRHSVAAHDGDEAPTVLGDPCTHFGSSADVANSRTMLARRARGHAACHSHSRAEASVTMPCGVMAGLGPNVTKDCRSGRLAQRGRSSTAFGRFLGSRLYRTGRQPLRGRPPRKPISRRMSSRSRSLATNFSILEDDFARSSMTIACPCCLVGDATAPGWHELLPVRTSIQSNSGLSQGPAGASGAFFFTFEAMTRTAKEVKLECVIENGEPVLYVEVDGKRIAKRYSGQNWISLEPGYTVPGSEPGTDYSTIEVEYDDSKAQPQ
jgi:hypothetical protein